MVNLSPQPGPQTDFFESEADIVIYGGGAGGGKSWSLLVEPLRHVENKRFGAVCFRRTTKQITNEGSLWDEASAIYPLLSAQPNSSSLTWRFPPGSTVQFAHLEHEKDKLSWQGSAIPLLLFDELTHFSETQFIYMLSRNRSTCGIKPYVRCTCNPENDSWVKRLIQWWIGEDGFPIKERSGVVRWFIRIKGELIWGDSQDELHEVYGYGEDIKPKSITFIPALLSDNKILMEKDTGYLANLLAQEEHDQQALLHGNWNASASMGEMFKNHHFEIIESCPEEILLKFRYWDRAATKPSPNNKNPDWCAGVLMGKGISGTVYVLDVERFREGPNEVKKNIKAISQRDGVGVTVFIEEDPGQAGKVEAHDLIVYLSGFDVKAIRPSGDKVTRAKPFAAQCQALNVKLIKGDWNTPYIKELVNFPLGDKKDQVDASSGCFTQLNEGNVGTFTRSHLQNNIKRTSNPSQW